MTKVQACHRLMCLALAPLSWCLCYLVWVAVFAAKLLMYYFLRHSTNAVISEILTWLMVELSIAVRVEDGTPVSAEVL